MLLTSTTVSGLQSLMDTANEYITQHGLRFSPLKTNCLIQGKNPFDKIPSWFLKNNKISIKSNVNYLGVSLSECNNNNNDHVQARISACRKAFYSLQSSGMCYDLSIDTSIHIWLTVCQSVLSYGCETIWLRLIWTLVWTRVQIKRQVSNSRRGILLHVGQVATSGRMGSGTLV